MVEANTLRIAEQDKSQDEFTGQIRELLTKIKMIQQRQEEAERYSSEKDFGMLDDVLLNLDMLYEQLDSFIVQSDAAQFLASSYETYQKKHTSWGRGALDDLQKGLMATKKTVAERVMLIFQIRKVDPTNPLILRKLDELSPDIPQAMKSLLRQVKEFYGQRRYVAMPVAKGLSSFVEYENTLYAFGQLQSLQEELGEIESKALVKAISKANEDEIFSQLEEVRQELRNHQSYLQELADLLAPYFEYKTVVARGASTVDNGDENICFLYEQGQDQENAVEEMLDSSIFGKFAENFDVYSFEKWATKVALNRKKTSELIARMKKGFDNGFGLKGLERDDDISLHVKKGLENYEGILDAVKEIKQLTPQRHRSDSDETLGYEDIYRLDAKVEWDDDFLGKKIRSINAHYKLAANRKASLLAYSEWYNRLGVLSVPEMKDVNVLLAGEFDAGLTQMFFDESQYGVQQEVDYLESSLEEYRKEYAEKTPSPNRELLDDLGEELLEKGTVLISNLNEDEERINEILVKIKEELSKLKGLQEDTARKLRPKKPAFSSIRKNLIEQHRLNPQDKAFLALLLTFQEKYRKSQKKRFSLFGR